jgi:hypothetical protein
MALIVGDSTHLRGRKLTTTTPTADQFVKWDAGAGEFLYSSISAATNQTACISFTYSTVSPFLLHTVASGDVIVSCRIHIATPFNATSTLSVGHAGSAVAIMTTTENETLEEGDYEATRFIEYAGVDSIKLYITPGTSSQGAGYVYLCWTKAE